MLDLIKGGRVEEFLGDTLFSGEMEDICLYHDKVYLTPLPPPPSPLQMSCETKQVTARSKNNSIDYFYSSHNSTS